MQRRTKTPLLTLVAVASALLLVSTSHADGTITLQADSGNATLTVKNGRILLKSDSPDNTAEIQNINASEAIFDTATQTLYIIDHDEQSISPVTKANIEQFGNTVDAAVGVLDSLPEEQRDGLAGLMRGFGIEVPESKAAPSVQLEPVSTQEFRGIQCQETRVIEAGEELGRICITQENSTPLSSEDYQSLLITQNFFLMMAKQAGPFTEQYGHAMPNLEGLELNGLVVYSNQQQADPETPSASFVVTSVDLSPVDDISTPAGYQTKPLLFPN